MSLFFFYYIGFDLTGVRSSAFALHVTKIPYCLKFRFVVFYCHANYGADVYGVYYGWTVRLAWNSACL